jgi:hypothetical protein
MAIVDTKTKVAPLATISIKMTLNRKTKRRGNLRATYSNEFGQPQPIIEGQDLPFKRFFPPPSTMPQI